VADFLKRGVHTIRKETEYKAAILYQALEQHTLAKPFVQDVKSRSQTVLVAQTGDSTKAITKHLVDHGLQPGDGYGDRQPGDGYGDRKNAQLRFANFPTHSKETYELLVDVLEKFQ